MAKCDRNHEVLFSIGRRQFLGYTGAGMLAARAARLRQRRLHSSPYQQTIAMGQQMIQQAVSDSVESRRGDFRRDGQGQQCGLAAGVRVASVPGQTKATPQTRFNIGSVSKLFPALAATILRIAD